MLGNVNAYIQDTGTVNYTMGETEQNRTEQNRTFIKFHQFNWHVFVFLSVQFRYKLSHNLNLYLHFHFYLVYCKPRLI